MIDIPYVECTCASLSALKAFNDAYPGHERAAEVARAIEGGRQFIASAQRPDGSWYGSWGCCFTYGCWFGLEGLVAGAATGSDCPGLFVVASSLVSIEVCTSLSRTSVSRSGRARRLGGRFARGAFLALAPERKRRLGRGLLFLLRQGVRTEGRGRLRNGEREGERERGSGWPSSSFACCRGCLSFFASTFCVLVLAAYECLTCAAAIIFSGDRASCIMH